MVDVNLQAMHKDMQAMHIQVATWNIAAVNNNPFEYWVAYPHNSYDTLMQSVEDFLESGEKDFPITVAFNDDMFQELRNELKLLGVNGLDKLDTYWFDDFRHRKAISQFLKDKTLGVKRMISMPDRITNTIFLSSGGVRMRPTVMNAYEGSLPSIDAWWSQWRDFMFHTTVDVVQGSQATHCGPVIVGDLISPLSRAKYPAITVDEQEISTALQILCLAIMDAILVLVLNSAAPGVWEDVRRSLCDALILNKDARVCQILATAYTDTDIIFIQEAAAAFAERVRLDAALHRRYAVLQPRNLDGKRDQNSLILIARARFLEATAADVTQRVLDRVGGQW